MIPYETESLALLKRIADALEAKPRAASKPTQQALPTNGGPVFGNFGRSKGKPIHGASKSDLDFYGGACVRTLNDPSKSQWHAKERELLMAINEEKARQGLDVDATSDFGPPPTVVGENPAPSDIEIPF